MLKYFYAFIKAQNLIWVVSVISSLILFAEATDYTEVVLRFSAVDFIWI